MKTTRINQLREVFNLAWQFVKRNGYTMSEALKTAWLNIKVRTLMSKRIVKFYYQKVDGSIREAYGTLQENVVPAVGDGNRKKNDTVQVYYDSERESWRCFKRANLISIAY